MGPHRETKSTFAPAGASLKRRSPEGGHCRQWGRCSETPWGRNAKAVAAADSSRYARPAAATVCFGMSFSRPVRRLRSLMAPSLGPLITPLKYTDYTAPKSITNDVGGAIVARSPGTTPRPQEDTEAPGRDQYPSEPQDPSKTPRPQQDTNTPARPKNLARNKVLTRSVRQVGSETQCFTQLRKSSLELVGFVTGLGARNRANLVWDDVLKGFARKVASDTSCFTRFL